MTNMRKIGEYQKNPDLKKLFSSSFLDQEISGMPAAIIKYAMGTPLKNILLYIARRAVDYSSLTSIEIEDEPTTLPIVKTDEDRLFENTDCSFECMNQILVKKKLWPYPTISSYHHGYVNKVFTPLEIAKKLIKICQSDLVESFKAIVDIHPEDIIIAAIKSSERYEQGRPLSVIDGVPFFVKENIKIEGYETFYGIYKNGKMRKHTSIAIKKLLDSGAILMGTTCMPPLGSNAIGVNADEVFSSPINPWDYKRYTGGSSSGNGVVLALGLCPFTIGSDSLGSIRVPSGWCGMVGLRPTYNRISFIKNTKIDKNPFLVVGPMTSCVGDAAVILRIIGGPCENDELSLNQPPMILPNFINFEISSLRFGFYEDHINLAEPCLILQFNKFVEYLKNNNCSVKKIFIPEIIECTYATFIGLMNIINRTVNDSKNNLNLINIPDISLSLFSEIAEFFSESDILSTRKQRTRSIKWVEEIFNEIDIILLLTTSSLPAIKTEYHVNNGFFSSSVFTHSTQFSSLSSLTGIPSISMNIGYDNDSGLPISLQMMSKWWREDILLSLANYIEKDFPLTRTPTHFFNITDLT